MTLYMSLLTEYTLTIKMYACKNHIILLFNLKFVFMDLAVI